MNVISEDKILTEASSLFQSNTEQAFKASCIHEEAFYRRRLIAHPCNFSISQIVWSLQAVN